MNHLSRRARATAGARAAAGGAALGLALGLVLTLAACSGEEPVLPDVVDAGPPGATAPGSPAPTSAPSQPSAPATPGPDDVQYVALGDSYASAPGVPDTDPADGCFRSDRNYAHVLAETAGLFLTDATCSGATSDDLISEQVPLLGPDTDVVTVGTGGNDFDLFVTMLRSCLTRAATPGADPDDAAAPAPTCSDVVDGEVAPLAGEIQAKMGAVLDAIADASPEATVYVVGYPALLPETGSCPDLVPMSEPDYPVVTGVIRGLSDALQVEAEARDMTFVDLLAPSRGHDICAEDPWVNGIRTGDDGTAPFHPFAVEQAAVASLISDML